MRDRLAEAADERAVRYADAAQLLARSEQLKANRWALPRPAMRTARYVS
jgi:hypothetical protein